MIDLLPIIETKSGPHMHSTSVHGADPTESTDSFISIVTHFYFRRIQHYHKILLEEKNKINVSFSFTLFYILKNDRVIAFFLSFTVGAKNTAAYETSTSTPIQERSSYLGTSFSWDARSTSLNETATVKSIHEILQQSRDGAMANTASILQQSRDGAVTHKASILTICFILLDKITN